MRAWPLLLLAGCAAPAPAPAPEGRNIPETILPPGPPDGRPLAEQVRSAESQRWYEMALAGFNKGDFEKAKISAQKAIQADPENLAARKLLSEVNAILVGGPSGAAILEEAQVVDMQARMEVAKHLRDGERYLKVEMFEKTRREFEAAELKIRAMPSCFESRSLMTSAREGLAASKR